VLWAKLSHFTQMVIAPKMAQMFYPLTPPGTPPKSTLPMPYRDTTHFKSLEVFRSSALPTLRSHSPRPSIHSLSEKMMLSIFEYLLASSPEELAKALTVCWEWEAAGSGILYERIELMGPHAEKRFGKLMGTIIGGRFLGGRVKSLHVDLSQSTNRKSIWSNRIAAQKVLITVFKNLSNIEEFSSWGIIAGAFEGMDRWKNMNRLKRLVVAGASVPPPIFFSMVGLKNLESLKVDKLTPEKQSIGLGEIELSKLRSLTVMDLEAHSNLEMWKDLGQDLRLRRVYFRFSDLDYQEFKMRSSWVRDFLESQARTLEEVSLGVTSPRLSEVCNERLERLVEGLSIRHKVAIQKSEQLEGSAV
jgi:hypothetical protein